jgi:hypothetical protein
MQYVSGEQVAKKNFCQVFLPASKIAQRPIVRNRTRWRDLSVKLMVSWSADGETIGRIVIAARIGVSAAGIARYPISWTAHQALAQSAAGGDPLETDDDIRRIR